MCRFCKPQQTGPGPADTMYQLLYVSIPNNQDKGIEMVSVWHGKDCLINYVYVGLYASELSRGVVLSCRPSLNRGTGRIQPGPAMPCSRSRLVFNHLANPLGCDSRGEDSSARGASIPVLLACTVWYIGLSITIYRVASERHEL